MSWMWLLPLGLSAVAAGGLWIALDRLRREAEALVRAKVKVVTAAEVARALRARDTH